MCRCETGEKPGSSCTLWTPAPADAADSLEAELQDSVVVENTPDGEVGCEVFEVAPVEDADGGQVPPVAVAHSSGPRPAADRLGVRQGTVSKAEGRGDKVLGPAVGAPLTGVLAA